MGFVVSDNGHVTVDHTTHSYGKTSVKHNYTMAKTKCKPNPLRIFSIFLRHGYKGSGKVKGDNCPFIYGAKGKRGLYVTYASVKQLCLPMREILDKFVREQKKLGIEYDIVIPMPSSHSISTIVAKRVAKALGSELTLETFRKANAQDIRQQINTKPIPHNAKVEIATAIAKAEKEDRNFSLSDVTTQHRNHLTPLELQKHLPNVNRVLLVDDLCASGTTLVSAKDMLMEMNPNLVVEALCLFSPHDGKIKNRKG
ncbi:phosphoribosyltransferase [Enterovibrio norvegicus]|uniref:phosphoribosyltransferase n=1 Tax=Enterovibrio norvegicus TaxID=188144 RepID=UPI00352C0871